MMRKVLETSIASITTGDFMSRFCSNLQLPATTNSCNTHCKQCCGTGYCSWKNSYISVCCSDLYRLTGIEI
ncbi:hypothetical protein B4U80_09848 [Leptotrombidium deliense]|uniref:Uncharacterized protein n=1 Tax=Leptotrombidium deliense TaxID=299467 RepID=A0A443S0H9_9ACAR|nr:hypothetical protein B4U80_09848 [Leptotrombidium deliense]